MPEPGQQEPKISVHDFNHIEISLDHDLALVKDSNIDLYFFFPQSLDVTSTSFPRDFFFSSLSNFQRLHSPKQIDEALDALEKSFQTCATTTMRAKYKAAAIQEVRLFSLTLDSNMKEILNSSNEKFSERVARLRDISNHLGNLRSRYVQQVLSESLCIDSEIRKALLISDEFLHYRLVATCSNLSQQNTDRADIESLQQLLGILESETDYRKKSGGRILSSETSESSQKNEYFYYRQRLLRKQIFRLLYLRPQRTKQDRIYRNWIAALGASFAGMWAQVADYQAHHLKDKAGVGTDLIMFMLAAVIIYVFKDRIKDVTKEYFTDKMKAWIPDFKSSLSFTCITKSGPSDLAVGQSQEFLAYLKTKQVPPDVWFVRTYSGRRDIGEEHQDSVVHYQKKLKFNSDLSNQLPWKSAALKDILRFDFKEILSRLDNPHKNLSVYSEDEGPSIVSTAKVYHLNCVIRITNQNHTLYKHFRAILNKSGIVRIDLVSKNSQFRLTSEDRMAGL